MRCGEYSLILSTSARAGASKRKPHCGLSGYNVYLSGIFVPCGNLVLRTAFLISIE